MDEDWSYHRHEHERCGTRWFKLMGDNDPQYCPGCGEELAVSNRRKMKEA